MDLFKRGSQNIVEQQIIPVLAYEDGVKAIEWLCVAFGFREITRWLNDEGKLAHGEIMMGGSLIMLASPTPDYQSPKHHREVCRQAAKWYSVPYIINGVLVYVDDIVDHFETAKSNGAVILSPIEYGGPGTRYRAEDLEGQRWMFMQK
jgi:PhnB protein